ncbi:MAG: DUF374 domain-containing protein [Xanthobacteraceae bacterium]|nr:MAG: DUF374 domain-containing protein [Xanthobacteraceae bacterium]
MISIRRLTRTRAFQYLAGFLAAKYLRLVWLTNRFTIDPPDAVSRIDPELPVIVTFWHGQHFAIPFLRYKPYWRRQDKSRRDDGDNEPLKAKVLVSRHRDGEINAIAAELLGVGTVRGSGDHGGQFQRKGGVTAFKVMADTLADGFNMALTADVPKVSRKAGAGIILLGRVTGRPIVPVAVATSRCIRLDNWDRTTINLPFGRGIVVMGETVRVPAEADSATMESLRQQLEERLDAVNRRAYALLGRDDGTGNA